MAKSRRSRRVFAALVFAWLAGCAPVPEPASGPALVGAWRSTVLFSAGVLAPVEHLEFLYVFNAGGTLTESSNYDAMPPVPPAYGEWRAIAPDQFEAKYTFFTTTPPPDVKSLSSGWLPAGSGVLTERIHLAADGRSYDSTITLEMFDTAGKPVAGGGEATAHGTRAGF